MIELYFTGGELDEALTSLQSTLSKCEKSFVKLKQGTAQYTLMERRIKSFRIAISLIEEKLGGEANG